MTTAMKLQNLSVVNRLENELNSTIFGVHSNFATTGDLDIKKVSACEYTTTTAFFNLSGIVDREVNATTQ